MTIDQFLTYVAAPLLSIITLIFGFVAYKASQITIVQKMHEDGAQQRFTATNVTVNALHSGIQDLHEKLDGTVIPTIAEVYKGLKEAGISLIDQGVSSVIKQIGYEPEFITEDKQVVFFGIAAEQIKISFVIFYDIGSKHLIFRSFAVEFLAYDQGMLDKLMDLSCTRVIGTIGIKAYGTRHILMSNYALPTPNDRVNCDVVRDIVFRLCLNHMSALKDLQPLRPNTKEILIKEYLALQASETQTAVAGEQEVPKLGSESKGA